MKHLDDRVDSGFDTSHCFTLDGLNGRVKHYFYSPHPNPFFKIQVSGKLNVNALSIVKDTLLMTGHYTNVLHGVSRLFIGKYLPSTLGLDKQTPIQYKWLLYPNPTDGRVFLQAVSGEVSTVTNIEVYDTVGKRVYSKSPNAINHSCISLDLGQLQTGIYHLVVRSEQGAFVKKIIVKNGIHGVP
ncbi:T9SS type A sorting domain-containing protein [Flavobacterium sp. JP2137]|uniref:T9SS type A sorting domain-containing protein n=1 Tax=Flavobacterium sp. JP2137 TaxID=3414510 RepID=UPI003D2FB2FF